MSDQGVFFLIFFYSNSGAAFFCTLLNSASYLICAFSSPSLCLLSSPRSITHLMKLFSR